MKKFLSILLSLTLIISSLSVAVFAADNEGEDKTTVDKIVDSIGFEDSLKDFNFNGLPEDFADGDADIEDLIQSGALDDVSLLGLTVEYLYGSSDRLLWREVTVSKGDLSLAKANLNMFLLYMLRDMYGTNSSPKLYTRENAQTFINVLGKILNPFFKEVTLGNEGRYSVCDTEEGFYKIVAEESGLTDIIQHNWCGQYGKPNGVNFKPLLYCLGFKFDDDLMLGNDKIYNGERVARTLLKSIVVNILQQGPIEYLLTVISSVAKTYNLFLKDAVEGLFSLQFNEGRITPQELGTLKGLFNLFFNGNDPADTDHLQFISAPTYRFAMATSIKDSASSSTTDTTEMFLYMLLYLNLVGKYKSNAQVVENIQNSIASSGKIPQSRKDSLISILGATFLGDTQGLVGMLDDIALDNFDDFKTGTQNTLKEFLASFFKRFADIIKKMINSIINFGKF